MNGTLASLQAIVDVLNKAKLTSETEIVIAPPSLFLLPLLSHISPSSKVSLAAQNAYIASSGAYTGEISATQLVSAGIPWVILGHSERRALFGEGDEVVAKKTKAALEAGLSVMLCVGETLEEREADKTMSVVERQLLAVIKEIKDWSKVVIAYEPVWAIGTGKVASPAQAQEVHHQIRAFAATSISQDVAEATRIIYGGSVSAKNSAELATQPDIDGFLVGGASLKPEFVEIINAKVDQSKL